MWMLDATAEVVCFEIHLYHETDFLNLSVRPVKNNKKKQRGPEVLTNAVWQRIHTENVTVCDHYCFFFFKISKPDSNISHSSALTSGWI